MLNITELAGGVDGLIEATLNDPKIKKQKILSTATLMQMAATIAEQRVTAKLAEMLKGEITEAVEMHNIVNGEFEQLDPGMRDDWTSALDDSIEAILEPYSAVLSASWLATATDGPMHEPDAIEAVAKSFGREVWKTINYDPEIKRIKSTNKILSAIGVVERHFEAVLNSAPQGASAVSTTTAPTTWMDALRAIREFGEMMGGVSAIPDLVDELDTASDDDDILATAAIERIGGSAEHVAPLRGLRRHYEAAQPGTGVGAIVQLLESGDLGAPAAPAPEPAPEQPMSDKDMAELMGLSVEEYRRLYVENPTSTAPSAAPPAPTMTGAGSAAAAQADDKPKRGRKKAEASATTSAETPTEALVLFSDNAKVKDDEVAEALGISRATYNNMRNAKQPAHLDDVQRMTLVTMIDTKIAALQQAKALIGG